MIDIEAISDTSSGSDGNGNIKIDGVKDEIVTVSFKNMEVGLRE